MRARESDSPQLNLSKSSQKSTPQLNQTAYGNFTQKNQPSRNLRDLKNEDYFGVGSMKSSGEGRLFIGKE